jgi:sec-independent protein translocase protein TatA
MTNGARSGRIRGYQTWDRKGGIVEGLISPWHIAILVVILLLAFGPKRLPELGSAVGKTITGFKQGLAEAQDEIRGTHDQTIAPIADPVQAAAPVAATAVGEPAAQPAAPPTLTVVDADEAR